LKPLLIPDTIGQFLPTKSPKPEKEKIKEKEKDKDRDIDPPFYPTADGKPPKVPQEKPGKKYGKDDHKKDQVNNVYVHQPTTEGSKYDYDSYEDDVKTPGLGPGFFNPNLHKNPYDYDPYAVTNQHPNAKPNQPGVPPQVSLEHFLHQINSQHDINGFQPIQQPNGINYNPYGMPTAPDQGQRPQTGS
jgi:hypothetical protein